ncbi:MAG: hypothetical protein LBU07_06780 [Coriobacteriales bacterium]|nr:hypothetical protein [Coriobacteriales bacterium]
MGTKSSQRKLDQPCGKNLRRAVKQAGNIVFDSHRVKRIPDSALKRELTKWAQEIKGINKLKFVNRHRVVIDIK